MDLLTDGGVVTLLEPCVTFAANPTSGSPVCAACGWLEEEHGDRGAGAAVLALPAVPERARRRAS